MAPEAEEAPPAMGGVAAPGYAPPPPADAPGAPVRVTADAAESTGGSVFGSLFRSSGGDSKEGASTGPTPAPNPVPGPMPATQPKPTVGTGQPLVPLLIYTAALHLAVHDAIKTVDAVQKTAVDLGGYLVRRDQQSITVRVPAEKYRGALEAIAKLGDVVQREESVEDVSDQFYDLQSRLRNAKAVRDRLEELLKQAKDVNEALAVQRELGKINADIESMEGKLKRLRELIAFSTITVHMRAPESDKVGSTVRLPFGWLDELGLPGLLSL
jgi:hypothetical protein